MSVGRPRAALFCFWQLPLCFCEICPVGLACACKWRTECDGSAIAVNYLMSMAAAGEERALCRMASPFQSARALTQIPLTDRDSGRKNFSNGTKKRGSFRFLFLGGWWFLLHQFRFKFLDAVLCRAYQHFAECFDKFGVANAHIVVTPFSVLKNKFDTFAFKFVFKCFK